MAVKQLKDNQIVGVLEPYGITASGLLCDQIRTYIDLLLRWNQKTSLTTVTEPEQILRFHFGESMFAAGAIPIRHGRLADVGSGPGFPAVPIRMVSDELNLVLIESNLKKATFLAEVVRELNLTRVVVRRSRMEDTDFDDAPVDFVTARALGIDDAFLKWASRSLNSSGSVVLWIGEADSSEIARKNGWNWASSTRIPQSDRRFILRGSKV
jgi:16S rRNA (guanine527-N7)-methyltransferase